MTSPGEAYVSALAARDHERLRGLLTSDVDFRGLTPGRDWEGTGPDQVLDVLLGHWFEPEDEIVEVREVSSDQVGDRDRVTYRFGLSVHGEPRVTEQHAFYEVDDDGRIRWLRVMCSGFRPDGAPAG